MARYDDDDDFDDDDRPRRKKKGRRRSGGSSGSGSSGTLWIIIGAVVFGCILLCGGLAAILFFPAMNEARNAARMSQSKNNLKQIGLALHNYHDTYNSFPPGSVVKDDGTVSLSWQGSILPYVDQAPLYNQIEMGADWNGIENMEVRSTAVPVYLNAAVPDLMAQDGLPASHYAGNVNLFFENKCLRIRDIVDGTSYTVIVGEVTTGLKSWGNPTNLRDPAAGLGATPNQFGLTRGPGGEGAQFLFVDGSVQFIDQNIDPEVLKAQG
ncbi:MAG: DUF1559 domain-containing protein, partial [Planctomycetaceae bacterium]|nr:DUF1559 domain-containing protein [Planctomycetaceae bacterium]